MKPGTSAGETAGLAADGLRRARCQALPAMREHSLAARQQHGEPVEFLAERCRLKLAEPSRFREPEPFPHARRSRDLG